MNVHDSRIKLDLKLLLGLLKAEQNNFKQRFIPKRKLKVVIVQKFVRIGHLKSRKRYAGFNHQMLTFDTKFTLIIDA